jgi:hypothetical protein
LTQFGDFTRLRRLFVCRLSGQRFGFGFFQIRRHP